MCKAIEDMREEAYNKGAKDDRDRTAKELLQEGVDVGIVAKVTKMTKSAVLKLAKSIEYAPAT